MNPFAIRLTRGFLPGDLNEEERPLFEQLQNMGAIEEVNGLYRLRSIYRAGEVFINSEGKGYLSSLFKEQKDLLIEPKDLNDAKDGDFVVVKRIIARRGRASAKVVLIIKRAVLTSIYISKKIGGETKFVNIKTSLEGQIFQKGADVRIYEEGTLFKVDAVTNEVKEVIGNIKDPQVDEKISLYLYNRPDKFPQDALKQAQSVPKEVKESEIKGRADLRHLSFCTIDPVTAKDFDDAIYWDAKENTLYVAIADVSRYVEYYSPIDKEAIKRGFTTYLPHKAFPMLPPVLSENICSLKPNVDRLSFVAKLKLNGDYSVAKAEFFEAVIHSKRRFNYDEIDSFLKGEYSLKNEAEEEIFAWLKPLYEITRVFKKKRLKKGFDFRSEEIKLVLDSKGLLKKTVIETGTPAHSLIEECMLAANVAAAKRFKGDGDAIFRIHEPPKDTKFAQLLEELTSIGIYVESDLEDINKTIREIQKEAKKAGLESEVDELIIKSMKQASYSSFNVGHFGLGFDFYSHFTSPIRRYSDLILHRLIKAQLQNDKEEMEYLLRNIEPLSARMSELEREAAKCEWDFRDRKFARWADENIGKEFKAEITEIDIEDTNKGAKAKLLEGAARGAIVNLKAYNSNLFDKIVLKISEADLEKAEILAQEVRKANV